MRARYLALGLVPALAGLAVPLLQAGGQSRPLATRDYPFQPVPFTAVTLTDDFWAPRIEINRTATVPVAFEQCERTNRVDTVRAGGAGAARRGAGQPQSARLSLRRHRRLQGDRGRRLHAARPSRSEARRLRRRPDRQDRRGAGAGRLPLHDAHHRPAASAPLGGSGALGAASATTATSSTTSDICSRRRRRTIWPPASGRCSTSR